MVIKFQKMAFQNYLRNYSNLGFELACDSCNSSEIIETTQGYVCSQCGIVLNGQKMEYHPSDKAEQIQHAVLDMTQIGNHYERAQSKRSKKFNKLNNLHEYRSNKENIDLRAKLEIRRIVEALHLPLEAKHSIYLLYKYFRKLLTPRSEFRDPDNLIPGVVYHHSKIIGKPIDEIKLLEVSKISKRNFKKLKKVLVKTDRNYCSRDRINSILNLILKVTEDHKLDMDFYHATKDLLKKLWNYISNTKDTVVVGVICSIIALCHYKDKVNVSNICETLNIRMSTIQSQVRKKIVGPFQIIGFQKLVRDSHLLIIVLDKLGLSQNEKCKAIEAEDKAIKIIKKETHDKKSAEIVFLEWEDMIANSKDQQSTEYHIFAVKANHSNNFKVFILPEEHSQNSVAKKSLYDKITLKIKNLYFGKDPP